MEIKLSVKEVNTDTYHIESIGQKEIYAPNGNSAAKWIREEIKKSKTVGTRY